MAIGSVIFVRTSSPMSWLIRKVTNSQYSHCCISCSHDNSWIIEADVLKKIMPRQNKYKEFEVVDLGITDQQKLRLLEFLLEHTNEKYDYKRIMGIFLYLIGITKDDNLWNAVNRTICNEIVTDGYRSIGVDFGDIVTPSDLANKLLGKKLICKCD